MTDDTLTRLRDIEKGWDGWWHPSACTDLHDEDHNCLDADGSIIGWREPNDSPARDTFPETLALVEAAQAIQTLWFDDLALDTDAHLRQAMRTLRQAMRTLRADLDAFAAKAEAGRTKP